MTLKIKSIRLLLIGILLILFLLIFIPFCFALANIYFQKFGVPKRVEKKILVSLKKNGILADVKRVKAGFFSGITLENVVLWDTQIQNLKIFSATGVFLAFDWVDLIRGRLELNEIKIANGTIFLPISENVKQKTSNLKIDRLQIHLENTEDQIVIKSFEGNLGEIPIQVHGDLLKPTQKELEAILKEKNQFFELSIKPWLPQFSALAMKAQLLLNEVNEAITEDSNVQVTGNVTLPILRPGESEATFHVLVSNVLYRGLIIDNFALTAELEPKEFRLSDLRLSMENQEYLQGTVEYLRSNDAISGNLSFLGYPYKLLKIYTQSHAFLSRFKVLPKFVGEPMVANLRFSRCPLNNLNDWNVDMYLHLRDVQFKDAQIKSLDSTIELKNGIVFIQNLNSKIAPDTDILGRGKYVIHEQKWFLNSQVEGNPDFITQFVDNKKFKDAYRKAWEHFQWKNSTRPYFDLELYGERQGKKSKIIIQGHSKMLDVVYNGIFLDRASGEVLVDFPGSLLTIHNLEISKGQDTAKGSLAWQGKEKILDFSLSGKMSPEDLLGLFHPNLKPFLRDHGLAFELHPDVEANGRILLLKPPKASIDVRVKGPSLNYKDARVKDFNATLDIREDFTKINSIMEKVHYKDCVLNRINAQFMVAPDKTDVTGKVERLERFNTLALDTEFHATSLESQIDLTSNTNQIEIGKWNLTDVHAKSSYRSNFIESKAQINHADFDSIRFKNISSDLTSQEERVFANLIIEEISMEEQFSMKDIACQGFIAADGLELSGDIVEFYHIPSQGKSTRIEANCAYKNSQFELTYSTENFHCFEYGKLKDLKGALHIENGVPVGNYEIGRFFWNEQIEANGIKGTFNRYNDSWILENDSESITFPDFSLRNVTMSGSYLEDKFESSLFAENFFYKRFALRELTGSLSVEKGRLTLNRISGLSYGGKTTGDFFYDNSQEKGKLWLTTLDMDFGNLLHFMNSETREGMQGKLSGRVDVNFDNSGNDLQLFGKGKFLVEEGNFWKVPIMSDFLQALKNMKIMNMVVPYGDLSGITELRSDFEFQGDKINFDSIKTDGSLVAITAEGVYWWQSEELDFRVLAKPLNPFFSKFLPQAIDPFSILLERRLKGSIHDPTWEEISAIRDFFRSKEEKTLAPSP